MPLVPGTRLGHYEILGPLGTGGMGEVYRATDTKLFREVAIKVLPEALATDGDRLARFEREARVLASLNHPNIAAIYGLEERALVMELVAGETLKGPLAFETALNFARQIADALEAAHDKGIVHRDLKPANIMVTAEGAVKVLDFGLAAIPAGSAGTGNNTLDSATVTMRATHAGMIMGTAAYMSPEQAAGKEVDKRADIWAFGVVLWEMLTGEPLFARETFTLTVASVLRDEPDWSRLPRQARPLLRKCLERDPKKRLRDIGDAMSLVSTSEEDRTPPPPPLPRVPAVLPWIIAAAGIATLAALAFVHFREKPPEGKLITASLLAPGGTAPDATYSYPAVSPDGKTLAFSVRAGDRAQLWLRPLDSLVAQAVPGTEGGFAPFWSPDSRSIAFFADEKLKRIDLTGGTPITLADAPSSSGGSWGTAGVIIFIPGLLGGVKQVPATGGTAANIALDPSLRHPSLPSFLPDGRHFTFLELRDVAGSDGELKIGSLDSRDVKSLGPANSGAEYRSGRLLFLRGTTLIAQPFNEKRMEAAPETIAVAQNVRNFTVSTEGTLIYEGGNVDVQQLTWFDRGGKALDTVGDPGNFFMFDLSPDRKRLALSLNEDVWILDMSRGLRSRFTSAPGIDTNPVWSPDGRNIAFCSNRSGRYGVYRKASNLSGTEELLYLDSVDTLTDSWSPDGKSLLVHRRDPVNQEDLAVLPVNPDGSASGPKLQPFLSTQFRELHGKFSPDGHWVAYISSESSQEEIYIAQFPGAGGKQQVSTTGGSQPRWRSDGKELFFVSHSGNLMAAPVAIKGNELEVGAAHSLGIPVVFGRGWMYDVSADGQRFLVAVRPEQTASPLTVVSNWPLLLKK
jgi:eukaryotic-like serine/threonine-protein kinase